MARYYENKPGKLISLLLLLLISTSAYAGACPKGIAYDKDIDKDGYFNPYCRVKSIHYERDGSTSIDVEYIGPTAEDDKCPSVYSVQNTSTTCQFDYTGSALDGIPDGRVDRADAEWIQRQATSADGPTQVRPASPGDHTADGLISYHDLCYFMIRSGYQSTLKQTCQATFPELSDWL